MALYAKLTSSPPFGQLTLLPADQEQIDFVILVECSTAMPNFPWEVTLCYKDAASEEKTKWTEVPLERSDALPMLLNRPEDASDPMLVCHRNAFTGKVLVEQTEGNSLQHAAFTAKFRIDAASPWYWMESQFGTANGEVLFQPDMKDCVDLYSLMSVEPAWEVNTWTSFADGASTYRLESRSLAAAGGPISSMNSVLGRVKEISRYFALVQMPEPWLVPRHGRDKFYIAEEATMCSFLTDTGYTITLLGLSGFDNVQVLFKSTDDGDILVASRNDSSQVAHAQIVASIAATLEASISGAMDAARQILKSSSTKSSAKAESKKAGAGWVDSDESKYELNDWYDGLAYCTWNSLGFDLSTPKILSGLDSLVEAGVKVSTLIIDDNWQSIDYDFDKVHRMHQGWEEFEAVRSAFPDGLGSAVSEIRDKHPYLKDVAVWHALLGYWGGISPSGKLAKDYKTVAVNARLLVDHKVTDITAIAPEDIHQFYDDFYGFLSNCGVTAVKTDVQYMLNELTQSPDRAAFLDSYPAAWTNAYLKHFKGRAISCMSQIPQNLLLSYLPTDIPRVMLRNSDDFFPEISVSHPLHIFTNAHNALLTQHLNVLPDWDMFQTSHPYSAFHAAARCISGGPLYITDTPGEHDIDLIKEMTATSAADKTVALRPTTLARAVGGWDSFLEGHVLKIGSFTGNADSGTGTSILGLFNIAEKKTSCFVKLSDFLTTGQPGRDTDIGREDEQGLREVLIRSHRTRRVFSPIAVDTVGPDSLLYTTLAIRSFDILYSHPVERAESVSRAFRYSILGLLQKMTGPAAVVSASIMRTTDGKAELHVSLKALGKLGIWIDFGKPAEGGAGSAYGIKIMGEEAASEWYENVSARAHDEVGGMEEGSATILEIDVEGFWSKHKSKAGDRGDIDVEVTFH